METVRVRRSGGLLEGIRILDMGWSWAGPYAGMILADLGAEVIKLESTHRIDILRWSGAFADGVRHYERSGYYTACNRGKKSVTVNLKDPRGPELVLRLVEHCDGVIENFAPRVLPGLGLGPDVLLERNPGAVIISMSGFGSSGPERDQVSYGDHLLHASGFASITGSPDDPHTKLGTFYGDPVAGMYAALAMISALAEREQTGQGCRLDFSQLEGLISMIPVDVLRASGGTPVHRSADKSVSMCPHGFYRCLGDDAWVAVAVRSDDGWGRLRAVLVAAGFVVDELPSLAERKNREEYVDLAVGAWTATRSAWEVTSAFQRVGVATYPVQSAPRLLWDDHLAARRFFAWVHRPLTGPGPIPGVTIRVAGGGSEVRGYAPLIGEHNEEVFLGLLRMPPVEYAELVSQGVLS